MVLIARPVLEPSTGKCWDCGGKGNAFPVTVRSGGSSGRGDAHRQAFLCSDCALRRLPRAASMLCGGGSVDCPYSPEEIIGIVDVLLVADPTIEVDVYIGGSRSNRGFETRAAASLVADARSCAVMLAESSRVLQEWG